MSLSEIDVLLIEDDPGDVGLVKALLRQSELSDIVPSTINLCVKTQLKPAHTFLTTNPCDLILLNLTLPGISGLDAFLEIKSSCPTIPIVIFGKQTEYELVRQAMQQGAQDYLSKTDLTANLLVKTIHYAIERHRLLLDISRRATELESQNMALNDFAHTVAHQIQGLLSHMVGYASLVDSHYQNQLNEPAQQAVDQIMQSGYKMNNVITELLFLASMRSDTVQVNELDSRRILVEVIKRLRYKIRETKAEIKMPNSWPAALGYAPWIEEVWLNYISNGLKYGSKDGFPPVLQLGATKEDDGMVRFWLADNGPGISEIDQKRLFRPHTRVTSKNIRGEGLGLSIVWRIVKKCGGNVGVESKLGVGSLFWFTLPSGEAMTT